MERVITKENPFFSVKREKLFRKDGTDTGYDSLYRKNDMTQLAVVSRDYQLVRHKDAVHFIRSTLNELGIENEKHKIELASNGSKMFYKLKLPDYRFNPTNNGGNNTALDGSKKKDEFIPTITVTNSYDRTTSFCLKYGAFRLVCSNGMVIGDVVQDVKLLHRHQNVDFDMLRNSLVVSVEETIAGLKTSYTQLNQSDGAPYFDEMIKEEEFPKKYKRQMIKDMGGHVTVEYDKNEETGLIEPVDFRVQKAFSAYLLWCILTSIVTHQVQSVMVRQSMNALVAQKFMKHSA